jgi:hypothetical protein
MRIALPALALVASLASPALAEEGMADDVLYFGTKNHVKLGTGIGFVGDEGVSITSLTPTLEARFAIGEQFGLQVVLPFAFVSVSPDAGEGDSRFDIANPSIAFEAVLDRGGRGATIVRGGVSLPLLSIDDSLSGIILGFANSGAALGTYGGFNLWRYMPESLGVFGEIVGAVEADGLFMEFGAGLGFLIPTNDGADTELAIQASAKMGLGSTVIPFIGLGFMIIPTEYESDSGDGDAFQFGVQAGVIAKLGSARLDVSAQLNLDSPFGFSFDDGGIFGLNVAATVPF